MAKERGVTQQVVETVHQVIETERAKRLRHRNWAVFAALLGFVALVYVVSIVKMKGG